MGRYEVRQVSADTPTTLGRWTVRDTATGEIWESDLPTLFRVDVGDEDCGAQLAACLLICEDAADRWPDTHPAIDADVMREVRAWIDGR